MIAEIRIEFFKLARKSRTYVGPSGMAFLIILLAIALKFGHELDHMREALSQEFVISGSFINAAFLTRYVLSPPVILTFLPLFTCTVFGDLLPSEHSDGTLRTILCRPVKRITVLAAKFIAGTAYAISISLGTGLFAYLLGILILGRGDLLSLSDGICILPEKAGMIRLSEAYLLVAVGMVSVGSIAFAVSSFLNNSNGAIGTAVGGLILSGIVGRIEFFQWLRPFLLTTYLDIDRFVGIRPDFGLYWKSLMVMAAYVIISFVIGAIVFCRRDVLS